MDREEIIKLIKEELEVELLQEPSYNMWGEDVIATTVILRLLGEEFSRSSVTVSIG